MIAGDLAQPDAFSPANDDISDLGAPTAASPWLYNQIGANLTGLLVTALALGLWRARSPDRFTVAATLIAPLAFAIRRLPEWRSSWLPSLAAIPAIILGKAVFSTLGAGAATSACSGVRKGSRQDRGLRWAARAGSAVRPSSRPL